MGVISNSISIAISMLSDGVTEYLLSMVCIKCEASHNGMMENDGCS